MVNRENVVEMKAKFFTEYESEHSPYNECFGRVRVQQIEILRNSQSAKYQHDYSRRSTQVSG